MSMAPGLVGERFRLEHLAGTGGMGVVFRARDEHTGGTVALKLLARAEASRRARFLREAEVLACVDHPRVVRYVAHGVTAAGEPYLAMEWLEGEDLAERLSCKPLSVAESVTVAHAVADALSAAHAHGILHRDIKPNNVFLVARDPERAKLVDFGLARATHRIAALTRTGVAVGTPGYVAPEQARGERDLDARTDVFGLGCVLFECLTGTPAFVASAAQRPGAETISFQSAEADPERFVGAQLTAVLAKVLLERPPRAAALNDAVPPALDDLVARMLAKSPDGRPADATVVRDALLALQPTLGDAPASIRPSSRTFRASSTPSPNLILIDLGKASSGEGDHAIASTLRGVVEPFGARLDFLADGSLLATLPRTDAGQETREEVAATTVRCACALRIAVPDAPMAVACAEGEIGSVIERAAALLRAGGRATIRVDDDTATLLKARFEIGRDEHGSFVVVGKVTGGAPLFAGKYIVDGELGSGGVGTVLRARHVHLRERVAIKVLRPELRSNPQLVARFLREGRAVVRMKSEHVARVFDVGVAEDGAPFIVMEYLDGQDVSALLEQRGALPVAEAVDLVLQACEPLAEAHALGIVHRDLKPANLFLSRDARANATLKLLDFGISKFIEPASVDNLAMTQADVAIGSPHYMSPEQIISPRDVDARSDLWSLGVVLYELMTCRKPFEGESILQVCARIREDEPEPLRALRDDVPIGIERVVARCLAKAPGDRFSSVEEFAAALRAGAAEGPVRVFASRRRVLSTAAIALAMGVVAAAALSLGGRGSSAPIPIAEAASTAGLSAPPLAAASTPPFVTPEPSVVSSVSTSTSSMASAGPMRPPSVGTKRPPAGSAPRPAVKVFNEPIE